MQEKGTISIHTENIFPIIKKFLYSDNEIFLRELVANAVDATQKIKRLSSLGEYKGDLGELKVSIAVDEKKKTITISDNGLGMTGEEIKKYINQIAFSGATEFVEKFKDEVIDYDGVYTFETMAYALSRKVTDELLGSRELRKFDNERTFNELVKFIYEIYWKELKAYFLDKIVKHRQELEKKDL
jgi:hypothetical protein